MPKGWPVIAVESPLRADTVEEVERNKQLARNICRIAALRGYRPRASHLFYTQFLNDDDPRERQLGIDLGLQDVQEATIVWVVLRDEMQLSSGMKYALEHHRTANRRIRFFRTPDNGITLHHVQSFEQKTPVL